MINWTSIVDHIYCIHTSKYENRLNELMFELDRVNILNSGIFDLIKSNINETSLNNGVSDCTFNHIKCMKDAILNGYNKILILENDIRFLCDIDMINYYVSNFPNDANLILLDYIFGFHQYEVERINTLRSNDLYINFGTMESVYSAAAYIIDTSMIKHLVVNIENLNYDCPPDYFISYRKESIDNDKDKKLQRYVSKYNVAIQKSYDVNLRKFVHGYDNSYERYSLQDIDINKYAI